MTFMPNSFQGTAQLSDLYVIIKDIEVLSGIFPRGTILKVIDSSSTKGNMLRETGLCSENIVL